MSQTTYQIEASVAPDLVEPITVEFIMSPMAGAGGVEKLTNVLTFRQATDMVNDVAREIDGYARVVTIIDGKRAYHGMWIKADGSWHHSDEFEVRS